MNIFRQAYLYVSIITIMSCSSSKNKEEILEIYREVQEEVKLNGCLRNNIVKPLLRGVNEVYYVDNNSSDYYIFDFSDKDISRLNISREKGALSNDVKDRKVRYDIQYCLQKMDELNILAINNDSIKTELYTNYHGYDSDHKYVFVFFRREKVRNHNVKDSIWILDSGCIYETDRYKDIDNIGDIFDNYIIRILKRY